MFCAGMETSYQLRASLGVTMMESCHEVTSLLNQGLDRKQRLHPERECVPAALGWGLLLIVQGRRHPHDGMEVAIVPSLPCDGDVGWLRQ